MFSDNTKSSTIYKPRVYKDEVSVWASLEAWYATDINRQGLSALY